MFIVALSKRGQGFLYDYRTAHEVKETEAERVAHLLNTDLRLRYLNPDSEKEWTVHEVDKYSMGFAVGNTQRFDIEPAGFARRNGWSVVRIAGLVWKED